MSHFVTVIPWVDVYGILYKATRASYALIHLLYSIFPYSSFNLKKIMFSIFANIYIDLASRNIVVIRLWIFMWIYIFENLSRKFYLNTTHYIKHYTVGILYVHICHTLSILQFIHKLVLSYFLQVHTDLLSSSHGRLRKLLATLILSVFLPIWIVNIDVRNMNLRWNTVKKFHCRKRKI